MTKKVQYWFKAKRYGYGWSYPLTWQGWLAYAICLAGFIGHTTLAARFVERSNSQGVLLFGTSCTWLIAVVSICYKKGEPARWRWGRDD